MWCIEVDVEFLVSYSLYLVPCTVPNYNALTQKAPKCLSLVFPLMKQKRLAGSVPYFLLCVKRSPERQNHPYLYTHSHVPTPIYSHVCTHTHAVPSHMHSYTHIHPHVPRKVLHMLGRQVACYTR